MYLYNEQMIFWIWNFTFKYGIIMSICFGWKIRKDKLELSPLSGGLTTVKVISYHFYKSIIIKTKSYKCALHLKS